MLRWISWPGETRGKRERSRQLFFDFMNTFFPGHRHELRTAPGVGHSASAMYRTQQGRAVLFRALPG
jgi:hypothetical protein